MLAGGSGVAPFRGFWQARARQTLPGPTMLLIGARTPGDLLYRDELADLVGRGTMEVHVSCSRAARGLTTEVRDGHARLIENDADPGYIDGLLDGDFGKRLLRMITAEEDGGEGGTIFICGRTAFAHTVMTALARIAGSGGRDGARFVARLAACGRLQQDIFTTFAPLTAAGVMGGETYVASQVAQRNNTRDGYWMILNGQVYDLTNFMMMHPGGDRILIFSCGLDATRAFNAAEHDLDPGVVSWLDMYKIGAVRRLDFRGGWGVALTGEGVITVPLAEVYKRWLSFLFDLVGLENTLNNNRGLRERAAFPGAVTPRESRLTAHAALETRAIFDQTVVDALFGETLEELWQVTVGMVDRYEDAGALGRRLRKIRGSEVADRHRARTKKWFDSLGGMDDDPTDGEMRELHAGIEALDDAAASFLAETKAATIEAVALFEMHESQVAQRAGAHLVEILRRLPEILERYYSDSRAG